MTQARSGDITGRGTGREEGQALAGDSYAPSGARGAAVAVLALTGVAVVGIDQLTKQFALSGLGDGSVVRLLGGAIYLDLTRNSGAAFSIGSRITMVFPLIAFVVLGAIIWLARRLRSIPWALAMGLIVGGAFGNLIDRLFRAPGPLRGHVVDFISAFSPGGQAFPIFNAADSALFCGVVLAILLEFTGRHRDGTRARSGGEPSTRTAAAPQVGHSGGGGRTSDDRDEA